MGEQTEQAQGVRLYSASGEFIGIVDCGFNQAIVCEETDDISERDFLSILYGSHIEQQEVLP